MHHTAMHMHNMDQQALHCEPSSFPGARRDLALESDIVQFEVVARGHNV